MGVPSTQASNAIIYLTYGAFLYVCTLSSIFHRRTAIADVKHLETSVTGLYVAWRFRHQSKSEFLSSNRTQKGQICRCPRSALTRGELTSFLSLKSSTRCVSAPISNANDFPAIPIALNFIASGECISVCATTS